jgi:hypothetical protein
MLMECPRIGEYFPAKAEKWEIRMMMMMMMINTNSVLLSFIYMQTNETNK